MLKEFLNLLNSAIIIIITIIITIIAKHAY